VIAGAGHITGRVLGLLAITAALMAADKQDAWVRYHPDAAAGAEFSIEHPAAWRTKPSAGSSSIQIAAADESALLYVGAFSKPASSLEAFAAIKFGVMANMFKPLGPTREVTGRDWKGLLQEGQAKDGGQRAILCANRGDIYVSLTLYLDKAVVARRSYYDRLFTSLQFGK
jgi:hypothetical protein